MQAAMDSYQAPIHNTFLDDRHPCLSRLVATTWTGMDRHGCLSSRKRLFVAA